MKIKKESFTDVVALNDKLVDKYDKMGRFSVRKLSIGKNALYILDMRSKCIIIVLRNIIEMLPEDYFPNVQSERNYYFRNTTLITILIFHMDIRERFTLKFKCRSRTVRFTRPSLSSKVGGFVPLINESYVVEQQSQAINPWLKHMPASWLLEIIIKLTDL